LQRTGDDLDAKIRRAEKEVRALENTLQLMNERNSNYRHSLHAPDKNSQEYRQKSILENQLKSATARLQGKKREIAQVQLEMQDLDSILHQKGEEESQLVELNNASEGKMTQLMKEITNQDSKKQRTLQMITRIGKALKTNDKAQYETFTRDLHLKELKDLNNYLLTELDKLANQQGDVKTLLKSIYEQQGISVQIHDKLPHVARIGSNRPSFRQQSPVIRSRASSRASNIGKPVEMTSVVADLSNGVTFTHEESKIFIFYSFRNRYT
jgi:UDP-glucose:O-linked fucose beta-1,3-glucosyltransferase